MTKTQTQRDRHALWITTMLALAVAPVMTACSGDDDDNHDVVVTSDSGASRDASTHADGSTSNRDGAVSDGAQRDAAQAALAEPQSAHVLLTINQGEIQLAMLATSRAARPEVRNFANLMITDHTAATDMINAWLRSSSTTAMDNDVSMGLMADASATQAQLATLMGASFDSQYIRSQVTMHRQALDLIDARILPGAQDDAFRALVNMIRQTVEQHLRQAMALASRLPG
jgi:putative membrane protein